MRRSIAVVAVLSALLVMTAPVAAVDAVVVENTTATDFNNADTISGMDVEGSGESASVVLNNNIVFSDGFEDGDKAGWTTQSGSWSVTSADSFKGTYSLKNDADSNADTIVRTFPDGQYQNVSYAIKLNRIRSNEHQVRVKSSSSDTELTLKTNDTHLLANGNPVRTISSGTWYEVRTSWDYPDNEITVQARPEGGSWESTTFAVAFLDSETIDRVQVDHTNNLLDINLDEVTVRNPASSGVYQTTHTVDNAQTGWADLTVDGADVTVKWEGTNGSTWTQISSTTISSSQNVTQSLPEYDQYRISVNSTPTATTTDVQLHSEGIIANVSSPSASLNSPADGAEVNNDQLELNATVQDPDFGTPQGDSVDVDFLLNGNVEKTKTVTSNGSVTATVTVTKPGTNNWSVEATDSYGLSDTSAQRSFNTPSELRIVNETNPESLITGTANVTVTFFGESTIEERTTSDGTISFVGLPVNEEFTAVVEADGYYTRRVIIKSLLDQQTAYLLPKNATSADIVFQLDDRTGRFPASETRLFVEKAITVNNSTTYETVAADTFGASGEFAVTLEDQTRYRLRVENSQGETRVAGTYTTAGDDVAPVPIGEVVLGTDVKQDVAFDAALEEVDDGTGNTTRVVRVAYWDPNKSTSDLTVGIHYKNGTVWEPNSTTTGEFGRYVATYQVPDSAPENVSYTVYWEATRGTQTPSGTVQVGAISGFDIDSWNINSQLLSLIAWTIWAGLTGLVANVDPRIGTLFAPATATIIVWMGAFSIPLAALGLAGAVGVFAVMGR